MFIIALLVALKHFNVISSIYQTQSYCRKSEAALDRCHVLNILSKKFNNDNLTCLLAGQANGRNTFIFSSKVTKQDYIVFEYSQIHIVEHNTNHYGGLFIEDKIVRFSMALLSTCHLELVVSGGNLLNCC